MFSSPYYCSHELTPNGCLWRGDTLVILDTHLSDGLFQCSELLSLAASIKNVLRYMLLKCFKRSEDNAYKHINFELLKAAFQYITRKVKACQGCIKDKLHNEKSKLHL